MRSQIPMKKGIKPGTEQRCEMLRIFLEKRMSADLIGEYTKRMRGKSEEEKETIAAEIITEITKVKL